MLACVNPTSVVDIDRGSLPPHADFAVRSQIRIET